MRQTMLILFMLIAVGVFAIAEGRGPNVQTTTGPHVINLLRTNADGTDGRLWDKITVELAPGAVDVRDSQLGFEVIEVIYVLEGAGTLNMDGKPPVALTPGTVVQLIPKRHHVLTNTSLTQTLKVLVVDLVETEQRRLVLANRGTRQQEEVRQQNEGCQVMPNGDLSHQKTNGQDSTMKGLVV